MVHFHWDLNLGGRKLTSCFTKVSKGTNLRQGASQRKAEHGFALDAMKSPKEFCIPFPRHSHTLGVWGLFVRFLVQLLIFKEKKMV